ncbi:MAG: type II secretion system protein [Piscinibacter sp.]|uniref:type II secretion system protein n=1 Tax=Piscinibacter sp. TaxID=1903157 RepID=UPI003D0A60F2
MKPVRSPRASRGVVLMGLMVLLALGGLTLLQFAESAASARQRELETQLIWVGQQYRQALESYYLSSPGRVKHLPVTLDELVRDTRFPMPVRHLRKLYPDPLQPEVPWGILKQGNQVIGVYSQSDGVPLKQVGLGPGLESLDHAGHYSDWRFIFVPRMPSAPVPSSRPQITASSVSSNPVSP